MNAETPLAPWDVVDALLDGDVAAVHCALLSGIPATSATCDPEGRRWPLLCVAVVGRRGVPLCSVVVVVLFCVMLFCVAL